MHLSPSVRMGVLGLLGAILLALLWSGVSRYLAEERALAYAGEVGSGLPPGGEQARAEPAPAETPRPEPARPPEPPPLVVHVAGAVASPGVYRFQKGDRVADAIARAGGALPEGRPDALNLAEPLTDGGKVYVFTRAELEPGATPGPAAQTATFHPVTTAGGGGGSGGSSGSGAPVNINTASAKELQRVPGIGDVTAQRIVEYRNQHGPFKRLEDLTRVSGIGAKTLEKLLPHLTL